MDLGQVRLRFVQAVTDPNSDVADLLLDAMARQARRLPPLQPDTTLREDAAEIVAALQGSHHPLLAAVRDRLARHMKGPA